LELEHANKYRLLSIKKQFDDGIKDGTLFCDLLRLYAATLAFYLRLKSNGEVDKKHPIFDKMLQLRRRAEVMRPVYKKTLHLLLKILQNEKNDKPWNREQYLKEKHLKELTLKKLEKSK